MAKKKKNTLQLTDTQMTRSDYEKQRKTQSGTGTRMTKEEYENQRKNKLHTEPTAKSILPDNLLNNVLSYLAKQNQIRIAQQQTAKVKEMTQNARYSPEGDKSGDIYAAKMYYDTRNLRSQNQTYKNKQLAQDAAYAGRPELAYASKMIRDSAATDDEKIQQWNKFLFDEYKINTSGAKEETKREPGDVWKDMLYGNYTPKIKDKNIVTEYGMQNGWYDSGTDELKMSRQGLLNYRTKINYALNETKRVHDEMVNQKNNYDPTAGWEEVFKFVYDWDLANEEKIKDGWMKGTGAYSTEDYNNALKAIPKIKSEKDARHNNFMTNALNLTIDNPNGMDMSDKSEAGIYDLRKTTYEQISGESYEERLNKLYYQDEIDAFNSVLDKAIAYMKPKYRPEELDKGIESKQRQAEAFQRELIEAENEIGRRTKKETLEKTLSSYTESTGEYNPALIPEVKKYALTEMSGPEYEYEPQGTDMDKTYFWVNNPEIMGKYANSVAYARKEYFMTDDMRVNFNKMFEYDKLNGTNLAGQYYDALQPYLQTMLKEYQEEAYAETARTPILGEFTRAMSFPMNAVGGIIGSAGAVAANLGVESAKDPTSWWYQLTKASQVTRSTQNKDIANFVSDKVKELWKDKPDWIPDDLGAEFMLNVFDSVGDNIFAMGMAKGLSSKESLYEAKNWIQVIMSGEATSSEFIKQLENNKEPWEASVYAFGSGLVEWITEEVSLENILKPDMKQVLSVKGGWKKYLSKAMLAEGSEEVAADLADMSIDWLMSSLRGHADELTQRVDQLILQGVDPKIAERQVMWEKIQEIGLSGLAGAISGGLLAGGRMISNATRMVQKGRSASGNQNAYDGKTGQERLIDLAMGMKSDSVSLKIANELQEQIKKGKKISNYDLGRLAETIAMETGETQQQVIKDTVQRVINGQLVDVGIDKDRADVLAGIITESTMNDGKLTNDQRKALARDGRALQVWMEYNSDKYSDSEKIKNLNKEIRKSTAEQRGIMTELGDMTDKYSAVRLEAIKKKRGISWQRIQISGRRRNPARSGWKARAASCTAANSGKLSERRQRKPRTAKTQSNMCWIWATGKRWKQTRMKLHPRIRRPPF